ncbi:MAG: fumarylacetoacetate hydrolase family protein [Acidobacteria bacterium]|nr:fumarylacetoacetate hydrolase family protein [Acidobacteriota bacterium]
MTRLLPLDARDPGSPLFRLAELRDYLAFDSPDDAALPPGIPLADVVWRPPILQPPGFRDFSAFEEHVRATRARRGLEVVPEWYDSPVFYFSNPHVFRGHDERVAAPDYGQWLDFELEIAAVIGRSGRDISATDADDSIAGYTILNDWSLRDVQRHEMQVGLGPAKGKDFASSLGPWLVTPDELADRRAGKGFDLIMTAVVNGREVSRGNWRTIHYSFGEMIARASRGVDLYPGDIIGSGTVGTGCLQETGTEATSSWLKPGDIVRLQVERLGVLENEIVAAR